MLDTVLNIADAKYIDLADLSRQYDSELPAERYGGRMAPISRLIGAGKLGYQHHGDRPRQARVSVSLPSRERGNVLRHRRQRRAAPGRIAPRRYARATSRPVRPAAGGRHQIINTGTVPLRILAVSTAIAPSFATIPIQANSVSWIRRGALPTWEKPAIAWTTGKASKRLPRACGARHNAGAGSRPGDTWVTHGPYVAIHGPDTGQTRAGNMPRINSGVTNAEGTPMNHPVLVAGADPLD